MTLTIRDVRFTPESGHYAAICSIDVGLSFGVRVLSEDVDRNPAAKSKSSLLFLGAVERRVASGLKPGGSGERPLLGNGNMVRA
jgi:hypothetical protein